MMTAPSGCLTPTVGLPNSTPASPPQHCRHSGPACALRDGQQHPWPPPTRCQDCLPQPLAAVMTTWIHWPESKPPMKRKWMPTAQTCGHVVRWRPGPSVAQGPALFMPLACTPLASPVARPPSLCTPDPLRGDRPLGEGQAFPRLPHAHVSGSHSELLFSMKGVRPSYSNNVCRPAWLQMSPPRSVFLQSHPHRRSALKTELAEPCRRGDGEGPERPRGLTGALEMCAGHKTIPARAQ